MTKADMLALATYRPEQRATVRMGMAIAEVERRKAALRATKDREAGR